MGITIYSNKFKDGAVKHVIEDAHPDQEVAERLGVSSKLILTLIHKQDGNSRTSKNKQNINDLKEEISIQS